MCGIAGILDFGRESEFDGAKPLSLMLNSIQHRGPDDRGEEIISGTDRTKLWLGHQRLSILDLSQLGHQPMSNPEKSFWISSNGEVYNFRELRSEIEPRFKFVSNSDTEVLLRSYEFWRESCLNKLRGMFAFAIWDAPLQKLFLARDRLGIKPLYYYFDKNRFIFSSETRSLINSGLVSKDISQQGLFDYLAFGRVQGPGSIFNKIHELPPGSFLEVDFNGVGTPVKYWNPLSFDRFNGNKSHLIENIREILIESVRYRLVSDVPVGTFLSGGIDSSSIASVLSYLKGKNIKTLSVIFKERAFDESMFSDQIAKVFHTSHQKLLIENGDLLEALPSAISAMDQPTVDGINTFLISRAARRSGMKVILSGLGGDELFAGYDSFFQVPSLNRWSKAIKAIPSGIKEVLVSVLNTILPSSDKTSKLSQLLHGNYIGAHSYYLFRSLFGIPIINNLLTDREIVESAWKHHTESTRIELESIKDLDEIQKISWLELTHYMPNMLLRDSDIMSMANGLELRVPLIDHKLVELMITVPGSMRMKKGRIKPLLVDSLPRKLPRSAANRRKMGFTLPFDIWMRTHLKREIETVLLSPVNSLGDLISNSAVQGVWKDFLNGKTSWSRPWALYIVKKWAERNLG
tara:strand:+ start:1090 stop:2988 length:1899 start_codon:yes stop_codon:yes gene_type:complete